MATGLRYPGKVVIVTGGTRGIGEGIVREFGTDGEFLSQVGHREVFPNCHSVMRDRVLQGAKVVFCAPVSEGGRGEVLQRELEDAGGPGEGRFVVCDVLCEADIKALVLVTIELYGHIDCLVNNAGGHPPEQRIDDVNAEEFRSLLDLNLVSCFLTAKYALPHLRKTKGNIINISSLVGIIGQKYAVTYVATKGALTAMTKAMAIDESQYGVRVNSISPGNIWTSMWARLASQTANPEEAIQEGKDAQLLGRMGTPAECATAAMYLASDATFCTGTDLVVSAGAELGYGQKYHQGGSLLD